MNLLFSLDNSVTPEQDDIRKGLIYPSTNREWIEKSDTGFPFIKYVWISTNETSILNLIEW